MQATQVASRGTDTTFETCREDVLLIDRAKAGDKVAFGKLFERHHGRIFATCARMLANKTDAEDAVQHTFLEAWRCLPTFEGRSRFTTWLTRIAIFTCLGTRRRMSRISYDDHAEDQVGADNAQWASPIMAPDDSASHFARKKAVEEILRRVSPKKRAVLVMADFEGMTAPEIGEILGVPDATVRTRLFHARKELATLVKGHPAFADLFPTNQDGKKLAVAPLDAPCAV
jgi:RNA polymerase sigma-70 factor, ECF subfamily